MLSIEIMRSWKMAPRSIRERCLMNSVMNSGYPIWQSIIALPVPNSNNRYGIFHLRSTRYISGKFTTSNILYSEARVEKGNLGKVTSKNNLLETGVFSDYITAVRHGNGRDWWVMAPDWEGKVYHLFLLASGGYQGPMNQISQKPLLRGYPGQIVFSPDGSWLADCRGQKSIRLARFDRCEGRFYDEQVFDIQGNVTPSMGAAFSPNSSVLYVTTPLRIYQYDMNAADIANSKQIVAEYDGFKYMGLSTTFFQGMLAPDNKIYLSATNGTWHLHMIHQPDSLGIACMVEQHALKILGQHSFCMPNFPHFRLYDLHGSPCDTLGINGPTSAAGEPPEEGEKAEMRLWPNPATDQLTIHYPNSGEVNAWLITNPYGQIMQRGDWAAGAATTEVDISKLPSGSYFFRLQGQDGRSSSRLFTVFRP